MAQIRLPDPSQTQIADPKLHGYLSQLIKTLRNNINDIVNSSVVTTAGQGVSTVYNNNTPWTTGTGSPEGVITAPPGSMYTNITGGTGTTLYVKESGTGNTGWMPK